MTDPKALAKQAAEKIDGLIAMRSAEEYGPNEACYEMPIDESTALILTAIKTGREELLGKWRAEVEKCHRMLIKRQSLTTELKEMTDDRDNEKNWCDEYYQEARDMEAQLKAADALAEVVRRDLKYQKIVESCVLTALTAYDKLQPTKSGKRVQFNVKERRRGRPSRPDEPLLDDTEAGENLRQKKQDESHKRFLNGEGKYYNTCSCSKQFLHDNKRAVYCVDCYVSHFCTIQTPQKIKGEKGENKC